jgi:hypothetical protein
MRERQGEVIPGTVIGGDYYVVIDDAPEHARNPHAQFFMKRLYSPRDVAKYCE